MRAAAAGSSTTPCVCVCVNWLEEWRGGEGRLSHGGAERKYVISNGLRHFVVHLRRLGFNSVKATFRRVSLQIFFNFIKFIYFQNKNKIAENKNEKKILSRPPAQIFEQVFAQ